MTVQTNDGSRVSQFGSSINVTGPKESGNYRRFGNMLQGPRGDIISRNCQSDAEALGTVIGLHGGRRW